MSRSVARGLIMACAVALLLSSVPNTVSACECLDRLMPWNWCRGSQAATTYAPPYAPAATAAPAFMPAPCNSCTSCNPCVSQTCAYVPQTCYRTVCRTVPVTTCQAVRSCDPCTGCPVTCYRPVTAYQRCTQLIPYTTYRMVWSNPCATSYSPCATGCGATSYASPISFGAPVVGSGSSCCGLRAPVSSSATIEPSPETSLPQPTFRAPQNGSPAGGTTAPQTQIRNMPTSDPNLAPAPVPANDNVQPSSLERPSLGDPNQTARRTVRPVQYVSDARAPRQASSTPRPVDFGGWRSSSD